METKVLIFFIFVFPVFTIGSSRECRLHKNENGTRHEIFLRGNLASTDVWLYPVNETYISLEVYYPDTTRDGSVLLNAHNEVYWYTVSPGWKKVSLNQFTYGHGKQAHLKIGGSTISLAPEKIRLVRIIQSGEAFWLTCDPSDFEKLLSQMQFGYGNLASLSEEAEFGFPGKRSSKSLEHSASEKETQSISKSTIILITAVIVMALALIVVSVYIYASVKMRRKPSTDTSTGCVGTNIGADIGTEEHIYDEPHLLLPHTSSLHASPFNISSIPNHHQYHHDYPGLHEAYHRPEPPQYPPSPVRSISVHNSENSFYMGTEDIQNCVQQDVHTHIPNPADNVSEISINGAVAS